MFPSSISTSSSHRDAQNPNTGVPIMLASDLDNALHATLHDLLVDEGYHVCVPRDSAEGLARLRSGECDAIVIMSLPPEGVSRPNSWLSALVTAQSSEPIIALRLRKHCALVGLASGLVTHEHDFPAFSPLWNHLTPRWRATLAVPCELEALIYAIATASQRLKSVA